MKTLYDLTKGISDESLIAKIRVASLDFWAESCQALSNNNAATQGKKDKIINDFVQDAEIQEKLGDFLKMSRQEQRLALISTAGILISGQTKPRT